MKKVIRLTEKDLHNIIKESVDNILNEIGDTDKGQFALGRLAQRNYDKNKGRDPEEIDNFAWEKGGNKPSDAFQKGRDYQENLNEIDNGNELQSMVFDAIKSLDEAIMACKNNNCKAAMFNLPHVKQVLKYLSRIL